MVMLGFELVLSVLFQGALVFGSGYPKDSTTEWCAEWAKEYDVYECLPNPWGSGSVFMFFRFPDTSLIQGCLTNGLGHWIMPGEWLWTAGGPPLISRITFDQDKFCLDHDSRVVNRAKPGDSIDIEYKMTPSDTVVSDTLRGWFKAYYRGDIVDLGYTPVTPRAPFSLLRWTGRGVDLPASARGPFLLRDLRGRSIPLETQQRPEGIRVTPLRPPTPGVYHLTWPGGASTVLIPRL